MACAQGWSPLNPVWLQTRIGRVMGGGRFSSVEAFGHFLPSFVYTGKQGFPTVGWLVWGL